jgi:hypothetical protein
LVWVCWGFCTASKHFGVLINFMLMYIVYAGSWCNKRK